MTEQELDKLVEEKVLAMIKEDPIRLFQYCALRMGGMIVDTKAGNMTVTTDATLEGERYKVTCKTTVKKIKMPKHLL